MWITGDEGYSRLEASCEVVPNDWGARCRGMSFGFEKCGVVNAVYNLV